MCVCQMKLKNKANQGVNIRSESTQIVHWLIGQGLSLSLHVSIRRGKNDFVTSHDLVGQYNRTEWWLGELQPFIYKR